jgi:hypothetical protein
MAHGGTLSIQPGSGTGLDANGVGGVSCNQEGCFLNGIVFRAES